jgi:hypothetical protein
LPFQITEPRKLAALMFTDAVGDGGLYLRNEALVV